MTGPQSGSYWEYLEHEGELQAEEEYWEWRDRRNPRDSPKVWLPRAESEEDDE